MGESEVYGKCTASPNFVRHPSLLAAFPAWRLSELEPVLAEYEFRVTPYYASLIDWDDPNDPLMKIVLPDRSELVSDLAFDASAEADNTPVVGLQHKYGPTALLLVTDVCASYCRFCFRKRFTLSVAGRTRGSRRRDTRETALDVRAALGYVAAHPEITNVLLSGGDPLLLAPHRLQRIMRALRQIPHVRTIRIGTKTLAFDPARVTPELVGVLAAASDRDRRVYVAGHFSHSRELTPTALRAVDQLLTAGVGVFNQTPILRGVNDSADELTRLLCGLSEAGIPPYYLFQCRPVNGNERFTVTVQEGLALVNQVRPRLNGLSKRFRYVASHSTGKIEIVGVCDGRIVLRYHQARDRRDDGRMFTWPADQTLTWFDEPVALARASWMRCPDGLAPAQGTGTIAET